jgi:CRISPR-associated protein Cst1
MAALTSVPDTEGPAAGPVLALTWHPIQRCGAWAVAVLAGRDSPAAVTSADIDRVAATLTADIVRAAAACKSEGAYDWWKVLFALYPNAKPTHASRPRDPEELRPDVTALFAPDPADATARPCVFCARPSAVLRAKPTLPMFDTTKALNTLPPGVAGWPVCRACRVTTWALPYAAWLTAASATVLTCDNPLVERAFAERNVRRAARIRQLGFTSLGANASAETVTLAAVRAHAHQACHSATLWAFKNDNQEPWLRVTATRGALTTFIVRMMADPGCSRGWRALQRALHRTDSAGQVTVSGAAAAARLLFDREDRPAGRLADSLFGLASDPARVSARTVVAWRALCRLYLEVMCGMDDEQLGRLKPARELIAEWITQETNPRGRFNDYARGGQRLPVAEAADDGERPADAGRPSSR